MSTDLDTRHTTGGDVFDSGRFGPFFALDPWRPDAGWRPLDDPDLVAERVAAARTVLAERTGVAADALDRRAVASTVSLGLFARLVSPAFAATVVTGAVPALTVATLWWRPVDAGPVPMATSTVQAPADSPDVAAAFARRIVADIVAPVLGVFADRYRLSGKVLWGNAASALAGAARMLTAAEPALTERTAALVGAVVELPPLRGAGRFERPGLFIRRSCCLYYRIPGGGLCGDCVLAHR